MQEQETIVFLASGILNKYLVEKQKGSTSSHLPTQLVPVASKNKCNNNLYGRPKIEIELIEM